MRLVDSVHNNKTFYTTDAQIAMWFRRLNRHVFDNILMPFNGIVIKDMRNWWACVTYDDEIKSPPMHLHMNKSFDNKLQFINVLGHEMVHKWQLEINMDTGNHNKHFFSWRPKFQAHGLILTRSV
jgi:hypothetical protein